MELGTESVAEVLSVDERARELAAMVAKPSSLNPLSIHSKRALKKISEFIEKGGRFTGNPDQFSSGRMYYVFHPKAPEGDPKWTVLFRSKMSLDKKAKTIEDVPITNFLVPEEVMNQVQEALSGRAAKNDEAMVRETSSQADDDDIFEGVGELDVGGLSVKAAEVLRKSTFDEEQDALAQTGTRLIETAGDRIREAEEAEEREARELKEKLAGDERPNLTADENPFSLKNASLMPLLHKYGGETTFVHGTTARGQRVVGTMEESDAIDFEYGLLDTDYQIDPVTGDVDQRSRYNLTKILAKKYNKPEDDDEIVRRVDKALEKQKANRQKQKGMSTKKQWKEIEKIMEDPKRRKLEGPPG